MLLHPLTHRGRTSVGACVLQRRHIWRRRGRRRSEKIFEQPFSPQHRRGSRRVRGRKQDAALPEQSPALVVAEGHTPEVAAIDVRYLIVPRQSLVEKRVIGGQQIEDAAILSQHALEKQFGFTL